jgi:hypothetical protein
MGMANPWWGSLPESDVLSLPLLRADPPDSTCTCILCRHSNPVEWNIILRGNGQTIIQGLHERCRQELIHADERHKCTGWNASWCPTHGDCTCTRDEDGDWEEGQDENCPLHGPASKHDEEKPEKISLGQAIRHCDNKSLGTDQYASNHAQLASWLRELRTLREKVRELEADVNRLEWDADARAEIR